MLEQTDDVLGMSDEDLEKALNAEDNQTQPDELVETPAKVETEETDDIPVSEVTTEEKVEEVVEEDANGKALKGMQHEIAEQRKRRREAERELAFLQGKLEAKKEPTVAPKKPFEEITDDELIDGKSLKKVYSELEKTRADLAQQKKEFDDRVAQEVHTRTQKSEELMRNEYSASKVGEQYEYDRVIAEGFMPLLQADPYLAQRVRNSANPAKEAYKIALSNLYEPSQLIKKVSTTTPRTAKPAPKTLGTAPAGGGVNADSLDYANLTQAQISKLTDKQLEKLMQKI